MGKKSAKKDRGYQTASEWAAEGGGFKRDAAGRPLNASGAPPSHKTLPFTHCALTCEPFEDPVSREGRERERESVCGCPLCTSALRWARHTTTHSSFFFSCHLNRSLFLVQVCCPGGTIFDLAAAVPYVRDHGTHPITKAPLALADLTRLKFETGAGGPGTYACPVLGTAFTPASHIVAVRPTGRVYSWEALESLNVKPRHWQDLVEGAPFAKRDVIVLQDPTGRAAAGVGFVKPAPLSLATEINP